MIASVHGDGVNLHPEGNKRGEARGNTSADQADETTGAILSHAPPPGGGGREKQAAGGLEVDVGEAQ